MKFSLILVFVGCCLTLSMASNTLAQNTIAVKPKTTAEVIAASQPADWRPVDVENTLYLELASGRVIIELAPTFVPEHTANIKTLVRENYFDGLRIVRSQDNYVVQWGDPNAENTNTAKPIKQAKRSLPPEFTYPFKEMAFTPLPDGDVYAPEVGFSHGFPVARDPSSQQAWLTHCYGMVGVGRDNNPESGSGAEMYVVTGHSPRHLDRNIAVVGRVIQGMELLSTLPRGTGPLGFYEKPEQTVPIKSVRVAADVPKQEQTALEIMRTDTATFSALIEVRRNRKDDWFHVPAGKIELCNVPIPARPLASVEENK